MYLVLFILLLNGFLFGEETLSVNKAMKNAATKNPGLLQSKADMDASFYNYWSVSSNMLPTVATGFTKIYNDEEILLNFDGMIIPLQPKTQWQKSVDITIPLFTGGALYSAHKIARKTEEISRFVYDENLEKIKFETLEAYFNLVKMEGILEITMSARDLINKNIQMVEKMFDLGMVQKKDLLRAQVSAAEISQQIQQAKQGVRISRLTLNMKMGQNLDSFYTLETFIPEINDKRGLNDWVRSAFQNRPALQTAQTGVDIANWGYRASIGSALPSVAAIYHWEDNSQASGFSPETSVERTFLNVSFEIPLGLSNVAKIGDAQAQLRKSRYMAQEMETGVRLQVEANYLQYQLMYESIELANQQLLAAEENYLAVESGYENGESSQIELIDARNSLTNARINQINMQIDHYISYNRLLFSCGETIGN